MMYIYIITNKINNKIYVGQTKNIHKRFSQHITSATLKLNHCIKLERAIRKYGRENFSFEEKASSDNQTIINNLEKLFIKTNNSIANGYNIKEGGKGGPMPQSVKNKISKSLMGAKNHMFGKTLSPEHLEKLIGRKVLQEVKDKQSKIKLESQSTKGERNPGAKLNLAQVNEIRKLLLLKELTIIAIAKLYNVSRYTIHRIKSGTHWK